jgi:hypothetical protein
MSVEDALEIAYPFGDDPAGFEVWQQALMRNADTISEASARRRQRK